MELKKIPKRQQGGVREAIQDLDLASPSYGGVLLRHGIMRVSLSVLDERKAAEGVFL